MNKNLNKKLVKTLLVFLGYLLYTDFFSTIFSVFGLGNGIEVSFISDLLFFLIIVYIYKDNISNDLKKFLQNYNIKQKIFVIIKYVGIILIINLLLGVFLEFVFPNATNVTDENTTALKSLFELSSIYTIFKILIFATVAEELVFKESFKEIVNNKFAFVIISSLIYTVMNVMYTDLSNQYLIIDIIGYLIFAFITSIAYVKNDNNIFLIILIKFFYNLLPVTLLVIGTF